MARSSSVRTRTDRSQLSLEPVCAKLGNENRNNVRTNTHARVMIPPTLPQRPMASLYYRAVCPAWNHGIAGIISAPGTLIVTIVIPNWPNFNAGVSDSSWPAGKRIRYRTSTSTVMPAVTFLPGGTLCETIMLAAPGCVTGSGVEEGRLSDGADSATFTFPIFKPAS